jgi:L-phenylalanine/L-methionine N-acetyltransferase
MILRGLEPTDLVALEELCARPEIAAELDDKPSARSLQSAPGTNAALGAFEGERLLGAAGMSALDRPRLRHAGRAWLASETSAAVPLLQTLWDLASAWWKLDRLAITVPASTRMGAALATAGFQIEVHRRKDLKDGGSLVDNLDYGCVRSGLAFTPPEPSVSRALRGPLPASFHIRASRGEDAAAFARVYTDLSAVRGTLQTPFTPAEVWRMRLEANESSGNHMFVATVGEDIVGTCGLHHATSPRRQHVWSPGMGIVTAWQSRGVGHAMMRHLLAEAASIGVTRLELEVYADNARAIALYEKHGFVREGVNRAAVWRDNGFVDVLVMARLNS